MICTLLILSTMQLPYEYPCWFLSRLAVLFIIKLHTDVLLCSFTNTMAAAVMEKQHALVASAWLRSSSSPTLIRGARHSLFASSTMLRVRESVRASRCQFLSSSIKSHD